MSRIIGFYTDEEGRVRPITARSQRRISVSTPSVRRSPWRIAPRYMGPSVVVKSLQTKLSEGNRVKVTLPDGSDYSIDATRIKAIRHFDGMYFIEYETKSADFYQQHKAYVEVTPPFAVPIPFKVEEFTEYRCDKCGREIEWDADEPYCPVHGEETTFSTKQMKTLVLEKLKTEDELEYILEGMTNTRLKFDEKVWRGMAGGHSISGESEKRRFEVDVKLTEGTLREVSYHENPVLTYSSYDEDREEKQEKKGRFFIAEVSKPGVSTLERYIYALEE
jgi:hypothetical protein